MKSGLSNFEMLPIERSRDLSPLAKLAKQMPDLCRDVKQLDRPISLTQENRRELLPELSETTRERLKEKEYTDDVIDAIGSEPEAKIYEDANLKCKDINGKNVLIRTDIDYDQKDLLGQTNLQRMEDGRPPLDAKQKPIELHHIGQKPDSPLAELTGNEHRANGNDNILHNKIDKSQIIREDFGLERAHHWKARANQIKNTP